VILVSASFDAERERGRASEGALPPNEEPYVPLRDDRKGDEDSSDTSLYGHLIPRLFSGFTMPTGFQVW
jgi:hypothetical protein